MLAYYLITTVLTLFGLIFLVVTYEAKKINYYFVVLLVLMALSNVGYLAIATSEGIEAAILATKLSYLGGCFIPVVGLFMTVDICNIKWPRWLRNSMYMFSVLVFIFVTTIGYNDFYYKDQVLKIINGVSVVDQTYGIGHAFFYVLLYGNLGVQISVLIYAFIKRKNVSRKNITAIMLTGMTTILCFIIGRILNPELEVMPLVYVIDTAIFLYIYRRGIIYNVEDNVAASIERQDIYGYVMFDKKFNYLGCNEIALKSFPKLEDCIIDKKIVNITELDYLLTSLYNYVTNGTVKNDFLVNDKYYECNVSEIVFKSKSVGYILQLKDATAIWNDFQQLSLYNAELENFQAMLEATVDEQTKELTAQQNRIRELYLKTVVALSEVVDAKDRYTSGHSIRVAEYARMIAQRMGKSKEEQDKIYHAGLLHDVGKIRVSEEIINKPGKLSEEEFNIIKLHPIAGFNILKQIDNNHIAMASKYHHERYDGTGYPTGLAGESIPEIARILCVADSYDAMTSNRSYRKGLPQNVVRKEIVRCSGTQFDPKIAEIMLDIIDDDKEYKLRQMDNIRKKILLVDSNENDNATFKNIMSDDPSFEITVLTDVGSAINAINTDKYDLLVVDIDLDGIRKLEKVYEKYPIPVVLTTNGKYDPTLDFRHGCSDYITKPYFSMLVKEIIYYVTRNDNINDKK